MESKRGRPRRENERRAVTGTGRGAVVEGQSWLKRRRAAVAGQGYAINCRQGGVFRQLEGIRVSDRDLSDAAVAAVD